MQGAMEVSCPLGDITVTRTTSRSTSPMGTYSAVYSGTANPVDGLPAAACGETLLGVPQEVYERSAYIRQSGIAVDQDAALERRIAALITTGEEDTSYTAAAEQLKKQLNRRRYNKSGVLPQLEQDILALGERLRSISDLRSRLQQAKDEQQRLIPLESHLWITKGQAGSGLDRACLSL